MQSLSELKTRVESIDLWPESTNDDRCDNCKYYKLIKEGMRTASVRFHREF